MQQSLWTSLSALKASSNWLDRISNNMANQDTPGYAADEGSFADTFTQALSGQATGPQVSGRLTPPGWYGGTGTLSVSGEKNFSTMPLERTDVPTDLALQGPGFFVVDAGNGRTALTKAGNFQWASDGNGGSFLATQQGQAVLDTQGQRILAPKGASATDHFTAGPTGDVSFDGKPSGQRLAIAELSLPGQRLSAVTDNQFVANAGVTPTIVNRGTAQGQSTIAQGMLAMSNVDVTSEMSNLILAQRMFDLNSEAVQLTDRMENDANNIRA